MTSLFLRNIWFTAVNHVVNDRMWLCYMIDSHSTSNSTRTVTVLISIVNFVRLHVCLLFCGFIQQLHTVLLLCYLNFAFWKISIPNKTAQENYSSDLKTIEKRIFASLAKLTSYCYPVKFKFSSRKRTVLFITIERKAPCNSIIEIYNR